MPAEILSVSFCAREQALAHINDLSGHREVYICMFHISHEQRV